MITTRHTIILIIVGFCADVMGALLKILHYAGADQLLTLAAILQTLGGFLFLIKLLSNPKSKEFLDW